MKGGENEYLIYQTKEKGIYFFSRKRRKKKEV
jgi:hypothetical protein